MMATDCFANGLLDGEPIEPPSRMQQRGRANVSGDSFMVLILILEYTLIDCDIERSVAFNVIM